MKAILRPTCAVALLTLLLNVPLRAENPPGFVNFGQFTKPAKGEFVEVNLDSNMIGMALQLAGNGKPDLAEALGGLQSVRINVVGLDEQNREQVTARAKTLRSELDAGGWQKIVSVQDKKEDVAIYMKMRDKDAIQGLVISVIDGRKEAVFINVVGDVKMSKIGALGDKLNLGALKKAAEAFLKQATAPKDQPNENIEGPEKPAETSTSTTK